MSEHVIDSLNRAKKEGKTLFAFELLPPLKGDGTTKTFEAIDPLMEFNPSFINVTNHREDVKYVEKSGGLLEKRVIRRRPGTVGISAAIMKRYGVTVVPHLICGGMTRYDIEDALIDLDFLGINNILALRGDNLRGEHTFQNHPEGHNYASQLVGQIEDMNDGVFVDCEVDESHHSSFCIGVAGYPEKHAEAPNLHSDIEALKKKIEAGADYVVTQMCFDNQKYFEYVKLCRAEGIEVPIIPGLKPFTTKRQLNLLPQVFHVDLPVDLVRAVEACKDNEAVREVGVEWAIAQGKELKAAGIPALHFYTMGRSDNMCKIAKALF